MKQLILILSLFLVWSLQLFSQQTNIAEETHPLGFYLKKVVSNTTIASGQTFSYTIYYTFPNGAQNVTVSDVLPPSVVFHSLSVNNSCGPFTISTPSVGTNGTVSVTWSTVPNGGCSGSMTIVVSFPNGITCDGAGARNRVCLNGVIKNPQTGALEKVEFCTPFVSTTAQATNTWQIQKQILGATLVGGNCPWNFAGDTVTYRICVWKNNPSPNGTFGQLNLVGGVVTDVLPAGAQFISSNCGATVSGSTITWNIGNLSATQTYNQVCCDIKVYYPQGQFPNNSQITNTATLSGQLGSANQPCGQFNQSSSVCWTKVTPPPPQTQFSINKWVSTSGQPGCAGYYTIRLCNSGTIPITGATIIDTIPSNLSITSTSMWPSGVFNVAISGNIVTANLNGTLNPGACSNLRVYFNISNSATPNSTITNCAYGQVTGLAPAQACVSFVVNSPVAKACIAKEICRQQNSYSPGQIIRLRFRLQNIGGQNITGATITDNLNPNFEYIGNPLFYSSNTWNINCNPSNPTNWTPTPSISASGQTVTISGINIPASCQNLFWNGCGYYGNYTVPYYYVEFDVKIRDTAALGNIPNFFTISGGGLPQPVQSNTVLVLVTGTTGYTIDKAVSKDTTNWQSSLTSSAGSVVNYRLKMNISSGSVALRHVTFVDLLPLDNGTSDDKILQFCGSRNSQFNVTYNGPFTANPSATGYNNNATTLADANGISTATGAPANLFPNDCGTAGSWVSGLSSGNKNLAYYFGTVGISPTATVIFPIKISAEAQAGQLACNTFAAGGAVRHYLNSNTINDVPIGPIESNPVCITIDSTQQCYRIRFQSITPLGQISTPLGNACQYQVNVSLINSGPSLNGCVYTSAGTITPSSFVVPNGTSNHTFTFTDTPPQNTLACFIFGIQGQQNQCIPCDSVCVDVPPCPTQDTCCPKWEKLEIKCIGQDSQGNKNYQLCVTGSINCQATLVISTNEGSFTPSTFVIGTGPFNFCTNFTDTPPQAPGSIMINYYIVLNGNIYCRDSVKIGLPECPTEPSKSCCDFIRPKITTNVSWFSNGVVNLGGTVSAATPIRNFRVAIVSAQLKKWCPIIPPPPPSPWQRIFGDITNGILTPAPGASSMLTPFSRQIAWQSIQIPQDCIDWSQNQASFKIRMIFPAPPSFKCYDSLKFTVLYSFTDCKCIHCDTLITYVVVRRKTLAPIDISQFELEKIGPNQISLKLPKLSAVSEDGRSSTEINAIELNSNPEDLKLVSVEPKNTSVDIFGSRYGKVSLAGFDVKQPLRIIFEKKTQKPTTINLHYIARVTEEKDSDIITGDLEINIPAYIETKVPVGELAHDNENRQNYVRTFALAFINGDVPTDEVSIELRALPQPDGSVPNIIAMGPVDDPNVSIEKRESGGKTYWKVVAALESGAVFRPLYITVSDAKRPLIDAVEIEYIIRDANGLIIRTGNLILEGAVSGIIKKDDGNTTHNMIDIGSIIPNPAYESVTIALNALVEVNNVNLSIVDNLGRPVQSVLVNTAIPSGTIAIPVNIGNLANGTYLVRLRTPYGQSVKKLIINR